MFMTKRSCVAIISIDELRYIDVLKYLDKHGDEFRFKFEVTSVKFIDVLIMVDDIRAAIMRYVKDQIGLSTVVSPAVFVTGNRVKMEIGDVRLNIDTRINGVTVRCFTRNRKMCLELSNYLVDELGRIAKATS